SIDDGTGSVSIDYPILGSGLVWYIPVTVITQGNVIVTVSSFGIYNVTSGPMTVGVFKEELTP
ncbi:MAG: hypothetical protein FWG12_06165, partial [Holophagaceae bacterium]|nr:hypothetical protein [Holophagaceae bacterium]